MESRSTVNISSLVRPSDVYPVHMAFITRCLQNSSIVFVTPNSNLKSHLSVSKSLYFIEVIEAEEDRVVDE